MNKPYRRAAKRGDKLRASAMGVRVLLRTTSGDDVARWWVGRRARTDLMACAWTYGQQQMLTRAYLYGLPLLSRRRLSRDALVLVSGRAPWAP